MHRTFLAVALVVAALSWDVAPQAASRDHDTARRAVSQGKARPLNEIMAKVSPRYPGKLLDAQLNKNSREGRWIYRLRILAGQGRVMELIVDARNGQVLQVRK